MSNITAAFKNGKAFIAYIAAGDPSLAVTESLIPKMAEAGADLIEIGIPFSDPIAEGPVIQGASERALAAGATTDKIFESVRRIRTQTDIPLLFMTYMNVLFGYGTERFLKTCQEIGINGVIIPDVPFEEKAELSGLCSRYGIDLISLIAPTSESRIEMIAREAEGFLYCVSSLGVTGMRSEIKTDIGAMVEAAKRVTDVPCAVGFGVSTPEQAKQIATSCDGVIVGSAIVKLIAEHGETCIEPVTAYVKEMKDAIR